MEELRKEIVKNKTKTAIITFVIGLVLTLIMFKDWLPIGTMQDLDTIESSKDIKEGRARMTVDYVWDYFMYYTEGSSDKESIREYLVPVVSDWSYIGVRLSGKKNDRAYSNMNIIFDWEDKYAEVEAGDAEWEELYKSLDTIVIEGHVRELNDDEIGYWNEYMDQITEYYNMSDAEMDEAFTPLILVPNRVSLYDSDETLAVILTIIALCCLAAGIVLLISALFENPFKELDKYGRKHGGVEAAKAKAEYLYNNKMTRYGLMADEEMFMYAGKNMLKVFDVKDILWAYKNVVTRKNGVVTVGKDYYMMLRFAGGGQFQIPGTEAVVDGMLGDISKVLPDIIIGYSEEINRIFARDRGKMIAEVERRRNERLGNAYGNSDYGSSSYDNGGYNDDNAYGGNAGDAYSAGTTDNAGDPYGTGVTGNDANTVDTDTENGDNNNDINFFS